MANPRPTSSCTTNFTRVLPTLLKLKLVEAVIRCCIRDWDKATSPPHLIFAPDNIGQQLETKKKGATGIARRARLRVRLENELAAQFEFTRILRAGDLTELAGAVARVQTVVLGVVEGVERFEAKLEVRPLGHRERLVERSREVHAAGSDDGVLAGVAEALVRSACPHRSWCGEGGRIEPLSPSCGGTWSWPLVRTVGVSATQTDWIVADGQAWALVCRDHASFIDRQYRRFPIRPEST